MGEILKDFNSIDTAKDLKKRGLTANDHYTLYHVLKELANTGSAEFIQESIYNYFKHFRFRLSAVGIGWRVEQWKIQSFANLWNDLQTRPKSLLNNTCTH